jgi:outer membrane lipoprotein SlyB
VKNLCLFLFTIFISLTATAGPVTTEILTVEASKCVLVAKEDTTGKTVVGAGAGAAIGGIAGRLLFGKGAGTLGALAGGATGGLIGHNSGDTTYQCKLLVKRNGETLIFEGTSDRKISSGFNYKFAVQDGKIIDIF